MIYALDADYFNKLYQTAREICNFKMDSNCYKYDLSLPQENYSKLMNYQPIPTSRKKRSKLHVIKKSKIIKSKMNENDYDGMIVDEVDNKTVLKNYLARRNLGK